MSRTQETIDDLRRIPLFATRSRRDLAQATRTFTEQHVDAGQVLMRRGAPARQVMVIASGTAAVHRDGHEVARLGPGDLAGEVAALDGGDHTADVVALSDLVVQVCTPQELVGLLAVAPDISRQVVAGLAGHLRRARDGDDEGLRPHR